MALDFRICSQTAKMCYPEIDLGFNLMWFGLPLAVHLLGPAKAKRLVIGGELFGYAENRRGFHRW